MESEISLGSLLKDASPQDIDSFLKTFEKYEKLFDKGIVVIEKLERLGVIPAIIRTAGAKAGIKDLDKPLQNPLSFVAKTPAHFEFFRLMNDMPSEQIEEMHSRLLTALKAAQKAAQVKEEKPKDEGKDESPNSDTNTG